MHKCGEPMFIYASGTNRTTSACLSPCRCGKARRSRVLLRKNAQVTAEEMTRRLELLRVEHRDLDTAILALIGNTIPDQMAIARLKKRKLRLRDEMIWIEDQLVPDIIA